MESFQSVTVAPEVDPDTAWWWSALREGRLLLPYCRSCNHHFFPPMPTCPRCGSRAIDRQPSDGTGTIYSWIVVHLALDAVFAHEVPYTVVAVHLDEGVRIFGRIAPGPLEDGMAVRAVIYTINGTTLLGFERVEGPARPPRSLL